MPADVEGRAREAFVGSMPECGSAAEVKLRCAAAGFGGFTAAELAGMAASAGEEFLRVLAELVEDGFFDDALGEKVYYIDYYMAATAPDGGRLYPPEADYVRFRALEEAERRVAWRLVSGDAAEAAAIHGFLSAAGARIGAVYGEAASVRAFRRRIGRPGAAGGRP